MKSNQAKIRDFNTKLWRLSIGLVQRIFSVLVLSSLTPNYHDKTCESVDLMKWNSQKIANISQIWIVVKKNRAEIKLKVEVFELNVFIHVTLRFSFYLNFKVWIDLTIFWKSKCKVRRRKRKGKSNTHSVFYFKFYSTTSVMMWTMTRASERQLNGKGVGEA